MTAMTQHDDEKLLARFIEPARAADESPDVSAAVDRFRARLPETAPQRSGWRLPRFAALAAMLTGIVILGPLWFASGGGTAFAQVQQWFSSYSTLDVRTRIASGDDVLVDVRARATAAGDARVEQSGIVHIVDASAGTFTTLLPGDRYVQQPIAARAERDDSMVWVDKLAVFKGEAVPLDETRTIAGRQAMGHRLAIDDVDLTLWSDLVDHRPLLLEGDLPGGLRMQTTFEIDVPLSPQLFEVPAGLERVPEG